MARRRPPLAVVDRAVECARAEPYDIIQLYNRLRLRMRAGPGTADGPTSSPAITIDNHTSEGTAICPRGPG